MITLILITMQMGIKPAGVTRSDGFTIVELLVVIVVIGILAAITIISYTGVSQRATIASLTSDLDNASKQLKLDLVLNGVYPSSLSVANGGKGIPSSSGTTYQYQVDNTTASPGFCITATNSTTSYKITNDSAPVAGVCLDYGLVLNLDAGNPASYPGSGTTWIDLSGSGNNGTLINGVGYNSANQGSLVFDGVNDYVSYGSAPSISTVGTLSAWVYVSSWKTNYDAIIFKGPGTSWPDIDYGLFRNGSSNTFLGTLNDATHSLAGGGAKSSAISTGQWYNLVFTWDGSNTKFYTNNTLTGTAAYNYGAGTRSTNMKVGSDVAGSTYFFNGNISDIRIYNRTLSAGDVDQGFNNLRGRYGL
jgi:prepilin-type N-terminal cleavage/methylation domain-containing protein